MARPGEVDQRPNSPMPYGFNPASGVAFAQPALKLFIVVTTAASTFTVRDMNGATVNLGTLPLGSYALDIMCDLYTAGTPGNVNVAAFYR